MKRKINPIILALISAFVILSTAFALRYFYFGTVKMTSFVYMEIENKIL